MPIPCAHIGGGMRRGTWYARLVPQRPWMPKMGVPYNVRLVRQIGTPRREDLGVFLVEAVSAATDEVVNAEAAASSAAKATEEARVRFIKANATRAEELQKELLGMGWGSFSPVYGFEYFARDGSPETLEWAEYCRQNAEVITSVIQGTKEVHHSFAVAIAALVADAPDAVPAVWESTVTVAGTQYQVASNRTVYRQVHGRYTLEVPASPDEMRSAGSVETIGPHWAWVAIQPEETELLAACDAAFTDVEKKKEAAQRLQSLRWERDQKVSETFTRLVKGTGDDRLISSSRWQKIPFPIPEWYFSE